jgi:hypothetical protein
VRARAAAARRGARGPSHAPGPDRPRRPRRRTAPQLWEKFKPGQTPSPNLGASRDYNVDMVPKFMMANGKLVKTLIYTDVTKYLEVWGGVLGGGADGAEGKGA